MSSAAESKKDAALIQYAVCGPVAATSTPPITGPTAQLAFSAVCSTEFAAARSSSATRFGRPAYAAGRKKPVAIPAIPASTTTCSASFVNGSS